MIPEEQAPEETPKPKPNRRTEYPSDEDFLAAHAAAKLVSDPTNPRAVIEVLKAHGYRESTIRSTMWSLIDRGLIKMNNQFRLESVDA